jgi:hypothetical protein
MVELRGGSGKGAPTFLTSASRYIKINEASKS